MFTTYVLINRLKNKTYVGHTGNLKRRLEEHNSGKSNFTNKFGSWNLLLEETFDKLEESVKREKYFKSSSGRRWIKKYLF